MRRLLRSIVGAQKGGAKPRVPAGVRIYAIGDIHGRLDLLEAMQKRIGEDASNADDARIVQVFIGDYVDRGPDSKGVIEWLRCFKPDEWEQICLKGNHEAMLLDFLADAETLKVWRHCGGLDTLHSYGLEISIREEDAPSVLHKKFLGKLPQSHREFLDSLRLSVEFGDYFFAHAGVRPHRRLDRQKAEDLLWIRGEFVDSREDFGKVIVHGHSPHEEPEVLSNRINIDTGAYITNHLTCLVLEGEKRRFLTTTEEMTKG